MGHKVSVKKIDWDGIADELENIEKPQNSNSKAKGKLTITFSAIVISCLMLGTAFGMMITATSPTTPTVIEPGSGVSGADFVMFKDGSTYYAKNGTTGAIASSNANALTLLNWSVQHTGSGGLIALQSGDYGFGGGTLTIETAGIIIQGSGEYPRSGLSQVTDDTKLTGNIKVHAENVKIRDLTIVGHLTFGSNAAKTKVAHYCDVEDVYVLGNVSFVGLSGATPWQEPFTINFRSCYIADSVKSRLIEFYNPSTTGSVDHVVFDACIIDQGSGNGGDMIDMKGHFSNIVFQNCLLMSYANSNIFNYTQLAASQWVAGIKFIGCYWEFGATITVFKFNDPVLASSEDFDIEVIGGSMYSHTSAMTLIYSNEAHSCWKARIVFTDVYFNVYVLRFNEIEGIYQTCVQAIQPVFSNCLFKYNVTYAQTGTSQSLGIFENCPSINDGQIVANPIFSDAISLLGNGNTWAANKNYTVGDTPIAITITGGTGVLIKIYDRGNGAGYGSLIVSGLTNTTRMVLPIGYTINLGNFSVSPTVVVERL